MTAPLLETLISWSDGARQGVRVDADGTVLESAGGDWTRAWRFRAAGLERVRAAVGDVMAGNPLREWSGHEDPAERSTWRLNDGQREQQIDVAGPLNEAAPRLQALLDEVFAARDDWG